MATTAPLSRRALLLGSAALALPQAEPWRMERRVVVVIEPPRTVHPGPGLEITYLGDG